jgi:hypothetical protein
MNGALIVSASSLTALSHGGLVVPSLVADQSERASLRYVEFFTA